MQQSKDGMDCRVLGHGAVFNWVVRVGIIEKEMSEQTLVG